MKLFIIAIVAFSAFLFAAADDSLQSGKYLKAGSCLENGAATACMSAAGAVEVKVDGTLIWSSANEEGADAGSHASYFGQMKPTGEFVIYGGDGPHTATRIWGTGSSAMAKRPFLHLGADGELHVRTAWFFGLFGNALWSSGAGATPAAAAAAVEVAPGTLAPGATSLTDGATGIAFDGVKAFGGAKLAAVGAGVRAKNLGVAMVNVYSVCLYVDKPKAAKALATYKGNSGPGVFDVLMAKNFNKVMYLKFARGVGSQKIIDALTAVEGVPAATLDEFSALLLGAMGGQIGAGETIALGFDASGSMSVYVREALAGTVADATLAPAVFKLYLGASPVSQPAKDAFGAGVQTLFG